MGDTRVKGDVLDLDVKTLPASGSAPNEIRNDPSTGLPVRWDDGASQWVPLGSGGGGGSFNWHPVPGRSPIEEDTEIGEIVYRFSEVSASAQQIRAYVKVPESYVVGKQIVLYVSGFSPSTSNDWRFQTSTSLVRADTDAISSITNTEISQSANITNSVANQYRKLTMDLTDSVGEINSVMVSPGDLLRVTLTRITPTGTDDTEDVRIVASATEVKFS